jgi:hypothetical protein
MSVEFAEHIRTEHSTFRWRVYGGVYTCRKR